MMVNNYFRFVGDYLRAFISHLEAKKLEGEFKVYSVTFSDPLFIGLIADGIFLEVKVEDKGLKRDILEGKVSFGRYTKLRGKLVKVGNLWVLEEGQIISDG